jgi:serine protease
MLLGALPIPVAGAADAPSDPGSGAVATPSPWWVDWLEAFDLNNNRIDDEAETIAKRAMLKGNASALVPVLVTFESSLPQNKGAFLDYVGAGPHPFFFKTQPVADIDVPASHLGRLTQVPGVVAVEHDRKLRPALNVSGPSTQAHNGTGTNNFYNGSTAEDLGYTGQDMVVAVLDTGVQDQHAAFAGKWIAGAHVAAPVPVNCINPVDDDGHGTHVASTAIGSQASNSQYGTAKGAKVVEIKISASLGAASVSVGGIARGFEFVKRYNDALAAGTPLCGPNDDHIDVATLSFGSTGRGGPNAGTDEAFINALVGSGVAVTIAVGNCGPSPSATCSFGDTDNGISSPGNAVGSISVGSFDDRATVNRNNDIISGFSSRGPNNQSGDTTAGGATGATNLQDRYRKPEVSAPGQAIAAAGPAPFTGNTLSGTSMSTPHVAGIAALLLEAGEDVKAQTDGRNLMLSSGNGYSATGAYVPGVYPVRDAIIRSAEYKEAGAEAKWTGPNAAGIKWNNAWGYGQVNAFGAICWAWANVLAPAGATPPAPVSSKCTLADPDPTVTPTPTGSATPTPTPTPTESSAPVTSKTYYFHSLTGDNTIDQADGSATFDGATPTFGPDAYSVARDVPQLQNAGAIEVVDPTWRGSLSEPANSVSVNFWAEQLPDQATGNGRFTVRVLPQGATAYYELLPTIALTNVPAGTMNVKHTFTGMRASSTAPEEPLVLPAGALTFTIRGTFGLNDAVTELYFDSTNFPAGFTTTSGSGGGTTTSPSPTATVTPTPTGTPTSDPTSGDCGDYSSTPNDPLFVGEDLMGGDAGGQWGLRKINAPQVWEAHGITGCDVTVAVLDTGLDLGSGDDTHPDFLCSDKVDVIGGSDYIQDDGIPNDQNGHGTHVAGIIGACTDNGIGVGGVAPESTVMPLRVLDAEGSGNIDDLVAAIRKAADSGAHVINMSLGWPSALSGVELVEPFFPDLNEAIEYARSKGVVVVAAAGNESFPICALPAIAEDVICVGSSDTRDLNSWYGNFPAKLDNDEDFGPGLLAPGGSGTLGNAFCQQADEEILSTYLRDGDTCGDVGYEAIFGTSMASPHVAGVAALAYERIGGVRSAANARTIIDAIISSAVDLYAPGYDPMSGYGRLDALGAVETIPAAPQSVATSLALTDSSATSGQYSDESTFSALLADEDGAPIEGAEVLFELVGEDGTIEWAATTGADGIASATKKMESAPGAYNLSAHYAGDEGVFDPSSTQGGFVLDQEDTVTTLDVTGKGAKRQMTATLNEDGGALAGREIVFYANGTEIARGTTDSSGVVTLAPPNGYKGDHFLFEARYAGEPNFAGSSATDQT